MWKYVITKFKGKVPLTTRSRNNNNNILFEGHYKRNLDIYDLQ